MRVRVVWWELDGSPATIAQRREYLRDESVDAFAQVEGLRLKMWIADEERNRWGAVYLWESQEASERPLPSRAREIIGKDPDFEEWFDLEASVEGVYGQAQLARLGGAFAGAWWRSARATPASSGPATRATCARRGPPASPVRASSSAPAAASRSAARRAAGAAR